MIGQSLLQTAPASAATNPNWWVRTIDTGLAGVATGQRPSIAINPATNKPYVTYYDATYGKLRLAMNNGTTQYCLGTAAEGNPDGWYCTTIQSGNQAGYRSAIAFEQNNSGSFGVLYSKPEIAAINLARYATSGVLYSHQTIGDDVGPAENGTDQNTYPALVFADSTPNVAYLHTRYSVMFDEYNASFIGQAVPEDDHHLLIEYLVADQPPSPAGEFVSLDQAYYGDMQVAYRGSVADQLKWAGQTETTQHTGCLGNGHDKKKNWQCQVVDPTASTGNFVSYHAADNVSDTMRIAYYDHTHKTVKYAYHTGNASDSCGNGGSSGWKCQSIDTVALAGQDASGLGVALGVYQNKPIIAYVDKDDQANRILKVARYVGFGGNCGTDGFIQAWQCEVVDDGGTTNNVGNELDMAIDKDGVAYVAYYDATETSLKVARSKNTYAPTFKKLYTPSTIALNTATEMKFMIQNNYAFALSGLTFTDGLTSYAETIIPATVTNTCGGTVHIVNNNHGIKLTDGALAADSGCYIKVQVVGTQEGTFDDPTTELMSDQAKNAPVATATLTITAPVKQNQTITFAPLADQMVAAAPFQISATASSGLAVSFTASGKCTVSGNMVTLSGGAGSCSITAHQGGNDTYNAAPDVTRSFAINDPAKQNQTITFAPLPDRTVGDPQFAVNATASSGLAVTFTAIGKCTVSGHMVTLVGDAGSCAITAHQSGNATYNPAADVTRTFTITAAAYKVFMPVVIR